MFHFLQMIDPRKMKPTFFRMTLKLFFFAFTLLWFSVVERMEQRRLKEQKKNRNMKSFWGLFVEGRRWSRSWKRDVGRARMIKADGQYNGWWLGTMSGWRRRTEFLAVTLGTRTDHDWLIDLVGDGRRWWTMQLPAANEEIEAWKLVNDFRTLR